METQDNLKIYEAFESMGKSLNVSKITMWNSKDIYSYPPFFRFKFKGIDKNDRLYMGLQNCVGMFSGNLKWEITTREDVSNYILMPSIFISLLIEHKSFTRDYFVDKIGEENYISLIDSAIRDIPELAKAIRECVL
jgi:hypothetical protein